MRIAALSLLLLVPAAWAQQQPVFPRFPAAPRTCNLAARGWSYLNTTDGNPYVCDGATWVDVSAAGSGVGAGDNVDWTGTNTFIDGNLSVIGSGDPTKKVRLEVDGLTTGQTRVITPPDANTVLPIATQVLTIAGLTAARTVTFFDQAFSVAGLGTSNAFTGTNSFVDGSLSILGSGDPTKVVKVEADGCATGTTCTATVTANTTVPIASQPITLAGPSAARTWTADDAAFTIATRDRPNAFTSTVSIEDGNFSLIGSGDPTKVVKIEADGLGTGVTATLNVPGTTTLPIYGQAITYTGPTAPRTVTYPNQDFAVAGLGVDQTFTGVNAATTGTWTFGGNYGDANTVSLNAVTGCIEFEGTVADAFETIFCIGNPNADRNYFFGNLVSATLTPLVAEVGQVIGAGHVFTNPIFQYGSIEAVTATKTTSNQEGNECYTNTGDADGSTITLQNNPNAGGAWCYAVTVAQTMTIVPSAGETLYLGADQCVVSITSNTIGSTLTIRAVVGGSGGVFMSFAPTGTWVCNDV